MVFNHYRHPVTASVSTAAEFWGANRGANGPENGDSKDTRQTREK